MTIKADRKLLELIRKNALLNAIQHGGKAQVSSVIGRTLGTEKNLKTKAKELSILAKQMVIEVNNLSYDEQKRIAKENWPAALKKEKIEEVKGLPALLNADKYTQIVTRFSPNPDCVLHLGSARAIILSHEYARMAKGVFILRFEDTDPRVKKPVLEFYERIREDLIWLGCKADEEYIQSDRLPIYYKYTELLLRKGEAYVCVCQSEEFRKKILSKVACNCRDLQTEIHLERWSRMLSGVYAAGEAVVRIKTDLNHPNPAVRDWPALRIVDTDEYPHPRTGDKYHVWPLYNMAAGVDDHLMGVTHIIRGKEHLTNQIRQEYMYKYLGWEYPESIHYGRLKITGAFLSKSKIVQGVLEGLYQGWADPRLATFGALRKRGITPEAIKEMIIDVGPKNVDVVLSWDNLYAYNRKLLDPVCDRYFFVSEPLKLEVNQVPREFFVRLPLHPTKRERGFREYLVKPQGENRSVSLWISKKDFKTLRVGEVLRLMDLFNVRIEIMEPNSAKASFSSDSYKIARKAKARLIHWILVNEAFTCYVIMSDATSEKGIVENHCKKVKSNQIIQFQRFGFVRVEANIDKLIAYYAHR